MITIPFLVTEIFLSMFYPQDYF